MGSHRVLRVFSISLMILNSLLRRAHCAHACTGAGCVAYGLVDLVIGLCTGSISSERIPWSALRIAYCKPGS